MSNPFAEFDIVNIDGSEVVPADNESGVCAVEGCGRPLATRADSDRRYLFCWAHEGRLRRGVSFSDPIALRIDGKGPKLRWARLVASALRFALANANGPATDRANAAFRRAVDRYVRSKS